MADQDLGDTYLLRIVRGETTVRVAVIPKPLPETDPPGTEAPHEGDPIADVEVPTREFNEFEDSFNAE